MFGTELKSDLAPLTSRSIRSNTCFSRSFAHLATLRRPVVGIWHGNELLHAQLGDCEVPPCDYAPLGTECVLAVMATCFACQRAPGRLRSTCWMAAGSLVRSAHSPSLLQREAVLAARRPGSHGAAARAASLAALQGHELQLKHARLAGHHVVSVQADAGLA
jgi:hypothetical protein